jgi:AraC-like DNA-binding protein
MPDLPPDRDTDPRASNEERIDRLCQWIRDHAHANPGWAELMAQSGFNHRELIWLFNLYRKTTPMAYIRQHQSLGVLPEAASNKKKAGGPA